MTLKYESEILFDLMKRDGDDAPSDVLPYESELKEKYLQQVEGAYPKLMDYRAEWLNYNLNSHSPADFPVENLSNVTRATVYNVVPYAYKSAILSGDSQRVFSPTKNLFDGELEQGTIKSSTGINSELSTAIRSKNFVEIGVNTAFTLSRKKGTGSLGFRCYDKNKNFLGTIFTAINGGTLKGTYTTDSNTVYIRFIDNTNDLTNKYQIEIGSTATDYEEPNYELKSVKMPVLTTVGKNLYNASDPTMKSSWWIAVDDGIPNLRKENLSTNYSVIVPARSSTKYTYNGSGMNRNYYVFLDKDYNILHVGDIIQATIASPQNTAYVLFYLNSENIENVANLQIEEGSVATSYEPYKSNILTVNEEVELRGIGEVRDTLDCLTGEVVQKFTTKTYNGSENWTLHAASSKLVNCLHFYVNENDIMRNGKAISPQIKTLNYSEVKDDEYISIGGSQHLHYKVDKNKLTSQDVNGFKQWLSQNPFTVQYQLATESIKTVDLTVTDQDGNTPSIIRPIEGTMHLMTEGDTIKPLFSGEIPVEAITQNLASFNEG